MSLRARCTDVATPNTIMTSLMARRQKSLKSDSKGIDIVISSVLRCSHLQRECADAWRRSADRVHVQLSLARGARARRASAARDSPDDGCRARAIVPAL